jgi:hypothetical protein
MAIGGAAVWAAPMMHSVASAQAAASCGPGILDWDTFTTGSIFTNTIIGNTTITMGVSGVANTTLLPNNRRILAGPAGGINQKHLRFEMTPDNGSTNNGSRQTITFAFSNPVTNVQFSFFDIDNQNNAWGDRIVINNPLTTPYTFSKPPASTVIGNGTNTGNTPTTGRFRNSQASNNLPATSDAGNLNIRFAGPLTSFSFTYRNEGESGGQNQLISMSDMTFTC